MYYIYSNKISILILFCLLSLSIYGQSSRENYNYLDFKRKSYYFGMAFGTNFSNFKINQSKFFIGNDSINIAEGNQKGGFNIHMIGNLKMGENFDLRFTPGFSFAYRSFIFNNDLKQENNIEAVIFETPISIRYKSEPYKDRRVFVTAGLKYGYDVASNSKSRKSLIRISPHDFQWEVGIGFQKYYSFFIFSPEIKFSRGINSILIYNGDLNQSKVLENVTSQVFTLTFNFEG